MKKEQTNFQISALIALSYLQLAKQGPCLSHQFMLNIASVNMPKIKPETKVLIIKNLKSKSPAEVADIFNVSKMAGGEDSQAVPKDWRRP